MVTPDQYSEEIKQRARTLGFSHVGIAKAERLAKEESLLEEWLSRGYHAGMHWLERDPQRRCDPREVLPGAQSVIMVAWNYYTPSQHTDDPGTGKISRYAWGDDYHDILPPLLKELCQFVDSLEEGIQSRAYTDTGPVMEKVWAARTGIGWIGKHSNLITKDRGSWVFLGTILTTLPLDYDTPIADYCGKCTACIEACPTGAIVEPYVVDSTRCIPYLTIECKEEELPQAESMHFDNWIYGCDTCQDVCPWNRFAKDCGDPRFSPRAWERAPKLDDILALKQEEFSAIFRKSPVKRAKRKGLQRNARIVLKQNESHS